MVACSNTSDVLNLGPKEDFNLYPFDVKLKFYNTTSGKYDMGHTTSKIYPL